MASLARFSAAEAAPCALSASFWAVLARASACLALSTAVATWDCWEATAFSAAALPSAREEAWLLALETSPSRAEMAAAAALRSSAARASRCVSSSRSWPTTACMSERVLVSAAATASARPLVAPALASASEAERSFTVEESAATSFSAEAAFFLASPSALVRLVTSSSRATLARCSALSSSERASYDPGGGSQGTAGQRNNPPTVVTWLQARARQ
mmetsp:Transcript_69365/g.219494  ORF Transcript_69365/g.219494 Transcript_69365/m.219494 type:complete len:216 (-) Transcript_69365:801-1448(-)